MKYTLILSALVLAGCVTPSAQNMPANKVVPLIQTVATPDVEKAAKCMSVNGLPDPVCSPGAARTQDLNIICHQPAKQFRPTLYQQLKFKKEVMAEYGETDYHKVILDHVIPIEAGGDGFDLHNMFLQTIAASKRKDLVEHFIKRQICSGAMTAQDAQNAIAKNWKAVKVK